MSRRRRNKSPEQQAKYDMNNIVKEVMSMQAATQHIPVMVAQEVKKAWKQLPNVDPKNSPKSWFHDPLSLQYSLGYKDRRFSLTYDMLRRIAGQLTIVSAIVNTRSAQVAAFSQPYRWTKSLGFNIRHKDPDHPTTPAEMDFIKELEQFIMNCGRSEKNPYSRVQRDDFENFLRKIVRDSLVLDACTAEIVPDQMGIPYEFYAVDAATVRIASDNRYASSSPNASFHDRNGFVPDMPTRFLGLYEGRRYGEENGGKPIRYVQVLNGQIENVYSDDELMFGVRNPRSDIYTQGYGFGELESAITIITSFLNAELYNSKFFTSGSSPKGILNMKGDNFTPDSLEGFKRQWHSMAAGVENAWRTPILQSEGIEWIDLHRSNSEMEFGKWMEYLLRVICGVYLIDPSEINFDLHSGSSNATPMFESSQEWKIKASRDRGLKPLLRFLAKMINTSIIDKIDDHFTLEFVGLDELSENEKHEMLVEQISSYMTLNEARRTLDLPDLPGGDVPMNPVYMQALESQGLSAAAQQAAPAEPAQPAGGPGAAPPGPPRYSQNFNFNQNGPKDVQ